MRAAQRDPRIDLEAREILRVLLFDFTTWRTGACAPSLEAIARRARVSRATVCRRLALLASEAMGYVRRTRRAVLVDARAGWRGAVRWCQTTTAYAFALPSLGSSNCESHAEAPSIAKTQKKLRERGQAARFDPIPPSERDLLAERREALAGQWRMGRASSLIKRHPRREGMPSAGWS
jgi:DNA-binding transcriptional MocR family regulator